jgi:hypothetical protein
MNLSPISMRSFMTHPPPALALPASATTITNIIDIETTTTTSSPAVVTPGDDSEKIIVNGNELQLHMTNNQHSYPQLGLASSPSLCCKNCNCDACDIRFTNCGCLLHAVRRNWLVQ